jgi:hypothetical protein
MTRRTVALPLLAALLCFLGTPAHAQQGCVPPKDSNEEKLFRALSVPMAYGPLLAPTPPSPGELSIALEGTYLPTIDSETATPTYCRPGKGPENVNQLSVLPRPRVRIGLPGGFAAEASWVPPIRIDGVKSNLFGVSVERTVPWRAPSIAVRLRAHATFGTVHAPVTCPEAALSDPESVCFGGSESDDTYTPNMFGLDLSLGLPVMGEALRGYGGVGVNWLRPRFQVGFTDASGAVDDSKVETNLTRFAYFGGLTWRLGSRFAVSGEVYAQSSDAVTGRLALAYTLRGGDSVRSR